MHSILFYYQPKQQCRIPSSGSEKAVNHDLSTDAFRSSHFQYTKGSVERTLPASLALNAESLAYADD